MRQTHLASLNLYIPDLAAYPASRNLAAQLPAYPMEVVPIMDNVIRDIIVEMVAEDRGSDEELRDIENIMWKVRPYGLDNSRGMRGLSSQVNADRLELGPADIDKMVSIKGLAIRSTSIIPDMKIGKSLQVAS
jgi:DNA replication licensing factor MCM4